MDRLSWVIYLLILAVVGWLVCINIGRGGTLGGSWEKSDSTGLKCVYNCNNYDVMLQSLHSIKRGEFLGGLPLQATAPVQKTQSSAQLHNLSTGVEMLPIEMLRYGAL